MNTRFPPEQFDALYNGRFADERIAVLAGSEREAHCWANLQNRCPSTWRYVTRLEQVIGAHWTGYIIVGTFFENPSTDQREVFEWMREHSYSLPKGD